MDIEFFLKKKTILVKIFFYFLITKLLVIILVVLVKVNLSILLFITYIIFFSFYNLFLFEKIINKKK